MKQVQYSLAMLGKLDSQGGFPEKIKQHCSTIAGKTDYHYVLKVDNSSLMTIPAKSINFHHTFKDYKNCLFIWVVLLCLMILLQGCSMAPLQLARYSSMQETPKHFVICHGYGCRLQTLVELNSQEWFVIKTPLQQTATSPAQERIKIAQSIALIEQIAGQKTGTDKDVGGATIIGHGIYQMDCIDETINTSKYLTFLKRGGLIHLHDVATPARRGAFVDGAWPHNTAVIKERESGKGFAIDSWFANNGEVPYVIPLEIWLDGWKPTTE